MLVVTTMRCPVAGIVMHVTFSMAGGPRALLEPALAGGRGGKSFNSSARGRETEEKYSDPPGSARISGGVADDGGTHRMAAGDPGRGSVVADQVPKSDFGLERWRLQHTADVKEVAEYW
jgi:hypothetical protein